jgi:hypothetical protein
MDIKTNKSYTNFWLKRLESVLAHNMQSETIKALTIWFKNWKILTHNMQSGIKKAKKNVV